MASRGFRLLKIRSGATTYGLINHAALSSPEISGSRKRKSVLGVNTPEHHVMPRGVRSPAALRRICTSASSSAVAEQSITIALRRPHDAVGTRLAVCVRVRLIMGAFPRLEDVQERADGAVEAGDGACGKLASS